MKRFRFCMAALVIALVATSVTSPVLGQEAATWTPALQMEYLSIQQTALSPDGQMVAYVVREPLMEGEDSKYLSQIWMGYADGEAPIQYTRGEHSASSPAFSPDGRQLAFLTGRSGKNQIWMIRVRGGEAEQLTDTKNGISSFRWSPDGTRIAYLMADPPTEEEEKAKKEKRDVILVDQQYKYNHLYVIAVEPNEEGERPAKQITSGNRHVNGYDWSPDGTQFAFSFAPDPRINTARSGSDIALVPADSGAVTYLVKRPGADNNPRFSPDGQWIAFTTAGGTPQDVGLADVNIVSAGGGDPIPMTHTPNRQAGILGWSADSKEVYVAESFETTRELFSLPIFGEDVTPLLPAEGVKGSPSLSGDGSTMAFTFEQVDAPAEVYLFPVGGFEMQQVTNINEDVPRPEMGKTEVITWTSYDGMEIEGLLTYPVGYEEGRRYPLVLNIHGGPAGVYSQSFTGRPSIYMIQTFAQEGYAVIRPNPRGSTGYGKDFRFANVKDWGYGDYEDVMSGVDKVIDMGIGHPDSLAVMGWSYGGYLTSFLVTRTGRFKAASMGAGLPNLVSMVTTTDIGDYLVAHLGGEFWEDYETYEKHSAIYRIKEVTTPTQVIHGANDLRVPFTQGQEFYRALQRRGVETEMVVYPRTPHGPREPKFLMDVTPRILKWFDHHLGRVQAEEASEE